MTVREKVQKGSLKVGKYKVGLPVVSESYKAKTPTWIKVVGETCLFTGAAVSIIAATMATPPGWLILVGGLTGLAGRHIAKMFSEDTKF